MLFTEAQAQETRHFPDYYDAATWKPKLDSLREAIGQKVTYKNKKGIELATLIALSYYPLLQDKKIRIVIKDQKGAPVEASFSMWNFFKSKKGKIYIIIIEEGSFLEQLPLNKQVSALSHEMAHFVQYYNKGYLGTLTTLVGWTFSKKARRRFEKGADLIAIDHNLGPQLLDFAFYTSDAEIKAYMKAQGYDN
jgi:hypothetical protein